MELRSAIAVLCFFCAGVNASADDWPQWRQNAGRTAVSGQVLGELNDWKPLWTRKLPRPDTAFLDPRLQFDRGYEPIVLGKMIYISSNVDDSVTAFNTDSGAEIWKFFTNGPVRFAPVAEKNRVLFGSDDGFFYCVTAAAGQLLWKFQAVPSGRKLMGNRRLISVWPIRGGPVLKDGRVYFAAGVFPFEGVFVYCLDAATGKVLWLNDRTGFIYDQQPHNTEALGGLAPQGYLLIHPETNELIVPSSNAFPARFNLKTGKLIEFKLPQAGRLPGGWFASTPGAKEAQKLKRRGLLADASVNRKRHEDKPRSYGLPDIRATIEMSDGMLKNSDFQPGLKKGQTTYSIVAGDGKLFISTLEGHLIAFARDAVNTPPEPVSGSAKSTEKPAEDKGSLIPFMKGKHGYAVALGDWPLEMLAAILNESELDRMVSVQADPATVDTRRRQLQQHEDLKKRLHFQTADPARFSMPPYFAGVILVSDSVNLKSARIASIFRSVRPYGGQLILPIAWKEKAIQAALPRAGFSDWRDKYVVITRQGALEGSTNYTGNFERSPDTLVKAPLGILWFDDRISLFKRSPQPVLVDGTMISIDKNWLDASTRRGPVDYRLLQPRFSDVYTGRELRRDEAPGLRQSYSIVDTKTVQPSQYRPKDTASRPTPANPRGSTRINPITGQSEPRTFPMAYGCDNGIDYGNLYTMRSATAAFYDKTNESGTINLSGPRSGCTNSIIPANGVLNVPYFFEGCTCSYPLPTGLSLYSLPESQEQWTAWGLMTPEQLSGKIQRLGINFGAPGDRVTRKELSGLIIPTLEDLLPKFKS